MKPILVIGDAMLDTLKYGSVKRLNPEWPAPLLNFDHEEHRLGWALNVAANISAMWEKTVFVGKFGNDAHAEILRSLCRKYGIQTEEIIGKEPTTTKIRYIERTYNQQLLRLDHEEVREITADMADQILKIIADTDPRLVVFSDYKKWVITEYLAKKAIETGIPVIADAKPGRIAWFKNALLIKPNFKEFREHAGFPDSEDTNRFIEAKGQFLANELNTNLVITRWEKGASLITRSQTITHMPTEAQRVFDVTWAGDTFLAAMAVGIGNNMSLEEATRLGNKASGIAVWKVGTVVVEKTEIFP